VNKREFYIRFKLKP